MRWQPHQWSAQEGEAINDKELRPEIVQTGVWKERKLASL